MCGRFSACLALVLHAANRFTDAEAAYRRVLELAPQRMVTRAYLSLTLLALGRGEEAVADAALAELVAKYSEVGAYQIAETFAARGRADAAFEWLERAFAQEDPGTHRDQVRAALRPSARGSAVDHVGEAGGIRGVSRSCDMTIASQLVPEPVPLGASRR